MKTHLETTVYVHMSCADYADLMGLLFFIKTQFRDDKDYKRIVDKSKELLNAYGGSPRVEILNERYIDSWED